MRRLGMRPVRWVLALAGLCGLMAWVSTAATAAPTPAPTPGHYTGTLTDGGTWIADVPANWNGTLLLYSHGYGPLVAQDMSDPTTQAALLSMGYAMAGSSYDPTGSWWALGSAVHDQFETLSTVERTVLKTKPADVFAFGTSMGGLVSALEDQNSDRRINGSLTTCGLVGGANNLNQYQLDGEYAIAQLLAPAEHIQLTNFTVGPPTFSDSAAAAAKLEAAMASGQTTAAGRARLALALSFLNVSPWGDATQPGIYDFPAQEQGQYDDYTSGLFGGPLTAIGFIVEGRDQIEAAAGGEGSGTVGVNFAQILHRSSYYPEVKALYDAAGLSLTRDIEDLQRNATLRPDRAAYRWLARTSVPTGRLQVPELDIHTISDPLIPIQQERWYAELVRRAGDSGRLRQAFVAAQGHCNFTPAELIAALKALQTRVSTGSWGTLATPDALNTAASALPSNLGGGSYVPFWPERLTGAIDPMSIANAARSRHDTRRPGRRRQRAARLHRGRRTG
jgi:hypothetical protein